MPYTLPTVEEFRTRFPVFENAEDEQIDALLLEASASVDKTWVEADYQPAIMYLTAHLLATDSSLEGDEVGAGGAGIVASESFGGMSVSYVKNGGASSGGYTSEYASTSYGRRYLGLLKRNKPAVVSI